MHLTKAEKQILYHRLEAGTLAEVLGPANNDNCPWTEAQIEEAEELMIRRIEMDNWLGLTDVEKVVLKDCVEGSTWVAGSEAQYEALRNRDALMGKVHAVMERLGEKIAELIGEEVAVPTC